MTPAPATRSPRPGPHQEYRWTVGRLPYKVHRGKPCWPWPPDSTPDEQPKTGEDLEITDGRSDDGS